jgi:hypothetical protein
MTSTPNSSKKIEITVSPQGDIAVKTIGFTGSSCRDATRDLERALGVTGREHLLPEYFQTRFARAANEIRQKQ